VVSAGFCFWLKGGRHVKRFVSCLPLSTLSSGVSLLTSGNGEALLGPYCLIQGLHPNSIGVEDMSVIKLKAWCRFPDRLPEMLDLHVVEPAVLGEDGHWVPRSLVFPVAVKIFESEGSLGRNNIRHLHRTSLTMIVIRFVVYDERGG
jgi:hypothetical protein